MKDTRIPVGAESEPIVNERLPIFDPRDRMWFPENPSFHRVWVTDVGHQVKDFLDSGFNFVTMETWETETGEKPVVDAREGSQMSSLVERKVGRAGTIENATAYLMQIDKSRWERIKAGRDAERMAAWRQIHRDVDDLKNQPGNFGTGLTLETNRR